MTDASWRDEVHPHGDVVRLDERLQVVTGRLARSPVPRTMTVWRWDDGGLVLHSAVALDERCMGELEALGEPSVLIVTRRATAATPPRSSGAIPTWS